MLAFIRRHSNSIIVRIFLTLLALTFVLFFGISDVIRRLAGKDYVVKIGNVKINPFDLKNEKARRLGMLRGRVKDVNEKDLTANVLHQLIWENIVDQASREYGIIVSDETMKKYISGMSVFRDKEGRFNANMLRGFLQRIQVPEAMFLEASKKDIKNALIKAPFAYISVVGELDQFVRANLEKRKLSIVELRPSSFDISEIPTKEMLEEFYSNNPDLFTIEETRSFRILELGESLIEENIQIPEEEIKDAYDRSAEKEDRSYDNMKKELEANLKQEKIQSEINEVTRQIEDALMAGDDVAEVAKKFHLNVVAIESVSSDNKNERSNEVIKLPYKDDVLAVAFSIDEGTDSSFSEALDEEKNKVYWLLHVDSIAPKHIATFEKSQDKVLKKWKINKQHEAALELASNFITQVKEGNDLEKLAKENGRVHSLTQSFDRYGKLEDEKNKNFKNTIEKIHEDAFALEKSEANFKEIDGVVVVYQVKNIISPKEIDQKDDAKYKNELRVEMIDDMYQQLVGYLSKKYEIKVNYELLKEINEEVNQNSLEEIF
ncbi:MAG: SurA N-terminal domain-containing protein [Holosporaceae bacterium]|jgi:hypothetical protein|nr:SurA N-terminal domain-containing protein [Holosporaceae bacterium]